MKKEIVLLLAIILLILFFASAIGVFEQESSIGPLRIETGSFLTLRVDERLNDRELFPLD